MQVDLSEKTVIIILGDGKYEMLKGFQDTGLLSDNFCVVDALHQTFRHNPNSKYRILSRMTNCKPVHDNCVNNSVQAHFIRHSKMLRNSVFDVICLVGAMRTPGQVEFLADSRYFNVTTAKHLILIMDVTMNLSKEWLFAVNKIKVRCQKFDRLYYLSENIEKMVDETVRKFDLPVTLPAHPGICKSSIELNPTIHLLHKQLDEKTV